MKNLNLDSGYGEDSKPSPLVRKNAVKSIAEMMVRLGF